MNEFLPEFFSTIFSLFIMTVLLLFYVESCYLLTVKHTDTLYKTVVLCLHYILAGLYTIILITITSCGDLLIIYSPWCVEKNGQTNTNKPCALKDLVLLKLLFISYIIVVIYNISQLFTDWLVSTLHYCVLNTVNSLLFMRY